MEDVRGTDPRSLLGQGDPASCRTSAADLRELAEAADEALAFLRRQIALDLGGRWAVAYGVQCRLAADEASALAGRCRTLAEALGAASELLDRAHALLDRATTLAAAHGLVVAGRLVPPAGSESDAWEPWREAAALVDRARGLERAARRIWSTAWDGPRPEPSSPEDERCPGPASHPEPRERVRHRGPAEAPDTPRRRSDRDLEPETCGFTPPPHLSPTSLPTSQPTSQPTREGPDHGRC